MFLLNNCKLLIFSDVRHGSTASQKRQEWVNFGIQKSGCGCVCVHVHVLRARAEGTGWGQCGFGLCGCGRAPRPL